MRKRMSLAMITGTALMLAACSGTSQPESTPDGPLDPVGTWVLDQSRADGLQVFTRTAALTGDRPGYEFGRHGGLKVRIPAGPGTPAQAWMNNEGLWSRAGDHRLDIRHTDRDDPRKYRLEIMSLGPRRLTCRVVAGSGF